MSFDTFNTFLGHSTIISARYFFVGKLFLSWFEAQVKKKFYLKKFCQSKMHRNMLKIFFFTYLIYYFLGPGWLINKKVNKLEDKEIVAFDDFGYQITLS